MVQVQGNVNKALGPQPASAIRPVAVEPPKTQLTMPWWYGPYKLMMNIQHPEIPLP
jgi:hypothetical protein